MLDLETLKKIYSNLYGDINGYVISSQARGKLSYHDKSHTYGEVIPDTFFKIVNYVNPIEGEIFYDLGSGTGKAVILASLLFGFSKCIGIEVLKDLYETSRGILVRLQTEVAPYLNLDQRVEFRNEDFLHSDFSDANIIFAHSTCFYDELWENLVRKLEKVRRGTRIITVTRTINSEVILPMFSDEYQMGWGKSTVHYYHKI